MASKNSFSLAWICLFFGLVSIVGSGHAAQPDPVKDQRREAKQQHQRWISSFGLSAQQSSMQQRLDELNWINAELEKLDHSQSNVSPEEVHKQCSALRDLKKSLIEALQSDDKYGRAIASGLAGKDWDALKGEHIKDVWEGAKLGGLIRVSRACSDVLGKRIENSIDRVLGGTWDAFISTILDSWNTVYEVVFHSSGEPFTLKDIKGWQDLIKSSFEDMALLLKDGLKDSLRGHDMTLRQAPADAVVETEEEGVNGWYVIASGYVRQFDYIIHQMDRHLVYYDGNDRVAFYVDEIKRQLLETNKLLMMCESLKELDTLLDSNKSIIPALRKNILNLFTRLAELIEPQGLSSGQSVIRSSSSQDSSRRESSSRYDDSGPRSFRPY